MWVAHHRIIAYVARGSSSELHMRTTLTWTEPDCVSGSFEKTLAL